jgi:hypothetical protein
LNYIQDLGLIDLLGAEEARRVGLNADSEGVPTAPVVVDALRGVPFTPFHSLDGNRYVGWESKAPHLLQMPPEELQNLEKMDMRDDWISEARGKWGARGAGDIRAVHTPTHTPLLGANSCCP